MGDAFRLLNLEEDDMYAIGRIIRKADKLLNERRFREAYDRLCKTRRWFDPETVEAERTKARAHTERASERKHHKDQDVMEEHENVDKGEWTQVVQRKEKKEKSQNTEKLRKSAPSKTCDADPEGWEQAGRKKGKKVEDKREPRGKISSAGRPMGTASAPGMEKSSTAMPRHALSTQSQNGAQKFLCRYNVGIQQDRAFNVVRKLLGDKGSNMKAIVENSGAKLRIRGRGSGFLEGPDKCEASDEPLMICLSATSQEGFKSATEDVESLLEHVHEEYSDFCLARGIPLPQLEVVRSQQPKRACH